eukprot:171544-Alexandrium_andersonii.AAC.1
MREARVKCWCKQGAVRAPASDITVACFCVSYWHVLGVKCLNAGSHTGTCMRQTFHWHGHNGRLPSKRPVGEAAARARP